MPVGGVNPQVPERNQIFTRPEQTERRGLPGRNRAAENGREIYFEGTYTATFSGNPTPTPRYEYNQLLYKLDLADGRLKVVISSR